MPATAQAVALTDRYRSALLVTRERTARLAASAWLALDPRDLYASYGAWRATVERAVVAAKRQGVSLSDAYLAAFVAAELGTTPSSQGLAADAYLDTEDGRPLAHALTTPLLTVKAAVADGRRDALHLGLVRATRIVAEEVIGAPRRALADLMGAEDRVRGYRRVTGWRACGACLALATGDVLSTGERLHRHSHCRCSAEPVVAGVVERFRRPTGEEHFRSLSADEQAALFHGRGGKEKADLVRSGAVPFHALARREGQAVTPDQYTEASITDLRALMTGR